MRTFARSPPSFALLSVLALCPVPLAAQAPAEAPALVRLPLAATGLRDARPRYREALCQVLRQTPHDVATRDWPCERVLVTLPDEDRTRPVPAREAAPGSPATVGAPGSVAAPRHAPPTFTVAHVLGLGSDCSRQKQWVEDETRAHVEQLGHAYRMVPLEGLASSAANARALRDAVVAMPLPEGAAHARHIVLLTHSKGTVDALEMLVEFPEARARVAAVLSMAGAVGGSPLADLPPPDALEVAIKAPGMSCAAGDLGALHSLKPATRQGWLARHRLPPEVRYYAIVAQPSAARLSFGLAPTARLLAGIDRRNDGQLLSQDQLIPGGTLLGIVDADHWAVSTNLLASPNPLVRAAANRNDFPRRAVIEAALTVIREDLDPAAHQR